MRLTRILFMTKSVRDELLEMQKAKQKSKSISEFLVWLYKEKNLSLIHAFRTYNETRINESIDSVNKFFEGDLNKLGPDLHAATYTLKLGGKCRLFGSPRWLSLDSKNLEDVLPVQSSQNFQVEGLDLSKTVIKANGISNIERCLNLKTLRLRDCIYNDDWLLSRVSHSFSNTLENLDISNCPNVTDNGLLTLGYLK
ncbi:unnamed protein product [Brachionus calyciflorus]|uniref:ATP synthase subunit s, mitochondrial n=1 Tax=Brachionus calyciflorus TaxID=104777 RepID=A0A814BQB6_9BILA|nr:unnamed protein product [Brachionus calyciflorus]